MKLLGSVLLLLLAATAAEAQTIEGFWQFPVCAMHHSCRLDGEQLFCALENLCLENGREVLDWRGEERYVRRASCERDGRRQAQGIPVKCR